MLLMVTLAMISGNTDCKTPEIEFEWECIKSLFSLKASSLCALFVDVRRTIEQFDYLVEYSNVIY